MQNIVQIHIKITNPSWKQSFWEFMNDYAFIIIPLLLLSARLYKSSTEFINSLVDVIKKSIILVIVIVVGVMVMASFFAMPVFFFGVIMGWFK